MCLMENNLNVNDSVAFTKELKEKLAKQVDKFLTCQTLGKIKRLYNTITLPTLLYASEMWQMLEVHKQKDALFEKNLKKTH